MLILYDEGSTNGTFVNEQRITRQPLQPGDIVRFGNVRFRVE
jgi:pSer/pThr/pTyr-binding forkhead associated (FHA) protein